MKIVVQMNSGGRRELYFFRDQQGLEVDFMAPGPRGGLRLIEVKWSKTIVPAMAKSLVQLRRAIRRRTVECLIVHRAPKHGPGTSTVAPGVKSRSVEEFLQSYPSALRSGI
jgi:hypothetical protein